MVVDITAILKNKKNGEIVERLRELVAKEKNKRNWYVQIFDLQKILGAET